MNDGREARWSEVLAAVASEELRAIPLERIVERRVLESRRPPDFLFTSGRPNRYNPAGVECVYFSADGATAGAEFDRYWQGKTTQRVLYFCRASARVLDLTDVNVRATLGLHEADLFGPWRLAASPTVTQRLGFVVAGQRRFAGIRFPSDAAQERGFTGSNLVFFRSALAAPARIEIFDDAGQLLQAWP